MKLTYFSDSATLRTSNCKETILFWPYSKHF